MFDYFWIPLIAASISATVIFFIRPLALKQGLLDHPGGRKRHEGDIPLVGGIAVTISILVCSLLLIHSSSGHTALLVGLVILAITGVVDDLRGISPVPKLGIQLFSAILMTSWAGIFLQSLGDIFGHRAIEVLNWGIPLTLFAVVAVINALNMIDGLDGLAGGIAIVIFGWLAYIAGELGNMLAQRYCIIFTGALFGFLIFNWPNPMRGSRRVFLGDAGSLMLGYGIVWFTVELSQKQYNNGVNISPVVMLWICGFLLIDLLAVVTRRIMKGRNPLVADRTHVHHILARLKIPHKWIVCIVVGSNAIFGAVGILCWKYGVPERVLFLGFIGVAVLHLAVMRNAWRFVRFGRKLIRKT